METPAHTYTVKDLTTGAVHSYDTCEQARDARAALVHTAALDAYAECRISEQEHADREGTGYQRMMIHLRALDRAREYAETRYSCVMSA